MHKGAELKQTLPIVAAFVRHLRCALRAAAVARTERESLFAALCDVVVDRQTATGVRRTPPALYSPATA
jgi:hypothetical protein